MTTTEQELVAPERQYTAERLTVKATEVQVGDVVFTRQTDDAQVARIQKGRTRITFFNAADVRIVGVMPFDGTIDVLRKVETEESRAAHDRWRANVTIREELGAYRPTATVVVEEIARLHSYPGGHADSHLISSLITRQAQDEVMRDWAKRHEILTSLPADGTPMDSVAALEQFVQELTEKLVRESENGVNRSTNAVFNVMKDAENAAMARFIENQRYRFL